MHQLLTRQLKECLGEENIPEKWKLFIDSVAGTYQQLENDNLAAKKLISEFKKAKEEAEIANKLKSEFVANMSHELRTPLNAIIGYSEILEEDAQNQGLENFTQKLKKIISSSKYLLDLINDVLDLSKIESGKMNAFLERTHVPILINQLKNMMTSLIQANNNTFEVILSNEVDEMYTDGIRLQQSLMNLLTNAAKFTNKGHITLEVKLQKQDSKDWIRFSVKDTGIGIPTDKLTNLFTPFSQTQGTNTHKYGGSGLGLYLTKQFCDMLGGWIEADSKAGRGSMFTIVLPKESDAKASKPPLTNKKINENEVIPNVITAPKTSAFKGKSVLIIDDDPKVHREISPFLLNSNFVVLHAFDGLEGITVAKKYRPSIITLDVMMPVLDGWETLTRLKSDPVLCHIPIILLTMLPESKISLMGATDYVSKPIDVQLLFDKIRKITTMAEA